MKYHPSPLVCLLLTLLSLPSTTAAEPLTTPLQTIQFDSSGDSRSGEINGGEVFASSGQGLDQFEKFDPAVGTLLEVLITVEVSAEYLIEITSDSLIVPDSTFSISLDADPSNYIQASVIYFPANMPFGYTVTSDNAYYNGDTLSDYDPQQYGAPDGFYFYTSSGEIFGGFAYDDQSPTSGSIPVSADYFNPDDFIGTGNVTGLSFNLFSQIGTSGSLDNLESATIGLYTRFGSGNATLQYVYMPADTSPPIPTITNYIKNGTTHTINFTGAPATNDWLLKGSTGLDDSFPNDHTADATITELTPGTYQCVAALPSIADEPKYFFRIEQDSPQS